MFGCNPWELPATRFFFFFEHMNSCQIPTEPTSSVCHLIFETLAQWAWESACSSLVLALLFSISSKSYKERSISLPTRVELHLSAFLVSVMYSESLYFTSSVIQYPQEHCYLQVLSKKKNIRLFTTEAELNCQLSQCRAHNDKLTQLRGPPVQNEHLQFFPRDESKRNLNFKIKISLAYFSPWLYQAFNIWPKLVLQFWL